MRKLNNFLSACKKSWAVIAVKNYIYLKKIKIYIYII
jgi:hypothetical protein